MESIGAFLILLSICFFIGPSFGVISPQYAEFLIISGAVIFILGVGIYYYGYSKRPKKEMTKNSISEDGNSRLLKCVDCEKDVSSRAKACPHCGAPLRSSNVESAEALGVAMLIIPVLSILLIWFWIGQMPLIEGPGSKLNLLAVLTIIGTAILAAIEGSKIGIGKPLDSGKKINTPWEWFVLLLVFWVIAYPMYFWARSKYGLKNQLLGGIIIAIMFTWSLVWMNLAINQQAEKVQQILNQATQNLQSL